MTTTNAAELYALGFADLVSIIPPDARLSPNSKIRAQDRGKVPGKKYSTGWGGYDWRKAPPVEQEDADSWPNGAGVGLKTDRFPAVDIDILDAELAQEIADIAVLYLGDAPLRIGREPKQLLLYRTDASFGRMRLWIGDSHLVEVLGDGQQFVAAGEHPLTGKPYHWPNGLTAAADLSTITREDVEAFFGAVEALAKARGWESHREGTGASTLDRTAVDQEALAGDAEAIAEAVALIPNTNDLFPGRDDYLKMGYAIKGALGDEGLPVWIEWAERWEGNGSSPGNTAESATADWLRMKPPFEVGAAYLLETAQNFGFNTASDEFEAGDPDSMDESLLADTSAGAPIMFSDADLAATFIRQYGDELRYCGERSTWLSWDGARWDSNADAAARHKAGAVGITASARALRVIANPMKAEAVATRLASVGTKRAIVGYAEDQPQVRVSLSQLDANPYVLGVPGGMVDLRTSEVLPPDAGEFITRQTAVAPVFAPAPKWMAFLMEATGGDAELVKYLQRLIGYSLTGLKTEHNLAFIYGPGGNGKGVFLNTVQAIHGDYAKAASMDTFTASRNEKHPTDMAGLAGARLVTAQETQEGRRWDEQKVKTLTSADKVQARFMREDFFEFEPTFKLVFAGNHKPEIRNLDDAMKRRFHLIPFTIKPKTVNPHLGDELKAEWPQILAWMIEGARMWMDEGLNPPEVVIEATAEYFDEEDPIGQWLKERVDRTDVTAGFVSATQLFDNWREWAGENGEYARNVKGLTRELKGRGFRSQRTATARGFTGVRLTAGPGSDNPGAGDFA